MKTIRKSKAGIFRVVRQLMTEMYSTRDAVRAEREAEREFRKAEGRRPYDS